MALKKCLRCRFFRIFSSIVYIMGIYQLFSLFKEDGQTYLINHPNKKHIKNDSYGIQFPFFLSKFASLYYCILQSFMLHYFNIFLEIRLRVESVHPQVAALKISIILCTRFFCISGEFSSIDTAVCFSSIFRFSFSPIPIPMSLQFQLSLSVSCCRLMKFYFGTQQSLSVDVHAYFRFQLFNYNFLQFYF